MDSKEAALLIFLVTALILIGGGAGIFFVSQRRTAQAHLERAMVAERDARERALVTRLVREEPASTADRELDPERARRALDLILAERDEHLRGHPDCEHPVLRSAGDLAWLLGDAERAEAAWREGLARPLERETCQARLDALAAGRDPLDE